MMEDREGTNLGVELNHLLLDSKLLLEHGIAHMKDGGRIGKLLAIHHAHQAVELSLKIKAEQLGENPLEYLKLKKALKKHGIDIPYERTMDELNTTRNLAQHYGQVPEEATVVKLVVVAKEFLTDFWHKQFAVNYEDVSLSTMLEDQEIRKLLDEANESLERLDFGKALEQAILAIYKTIWKLEAKFQPPYVQVDTMPMPWPNKWHDFAWVVLSQPYASKLKRLLSTTGIVYLPTGINPQMQQMKDYKATREDALFAISLALEYVFWAEQTYS